MKAVCPTDSTHAQFLTTAHVQEEWVVSAEGDFVESLGALETVQSPDPGYTWWCRDCGAEAQVS